MADRVETARRLKDIDAPFIAPLGTAIECGGEALIKVYPSLAEQSHRFITLNDIWVEPFDRLQKRALSLRSIEDTLLYRTLTELGMPTDFLKSNRYGLPSVNNPKHYNPLETRANVYVDEKSFAGFFAATPINRAWAIFNGAINMMEVDLDILGFSPTRPNLASHPWRGVVQGHIERDILDVVGKRYGNQIDLERFKQARDVITQATAEQGELRAQGAMFFWNMPGQIEMTAEIEIGTSLQEGITAFLVTPPIEALMKLLQKEKLLPAKYQHALPSERLQRIRRAQQLLSALEIKRPQDLITMYIQGEFPDYLYTTLIGSKVEEGEYNPFNYGEIPPSGDVALEKYLKDLPNHVS